MFLIWIYDWDMFRDEPVQYPDNNPVLGRYLGMKIDFGPALKENTLKGNREAVNQLMHWPLNESDIKTPSHIYRCNTFDTNINERLGTDSTPYDYQDINI